MATDPVFRFMIPLQMPSRRVFIIAGAAIAGVIFLYIFSSAISAFAFGGGAGANTAATTVQSSSGTVYLTPRDAAAAVIPEAKQPLSEMNIANSGLVLLRGGRVTGVSGSTLTVTMIWGGTEFIWRVHSSYNTKFFTAQGEKGSLADIRAGDVITVSGTLSGNSAQPAVEAAFVRE